MHRRRAAVGSWPSHIMRQARRLRRRRAGGSRPTPRLPDARPRGRRTLSRPSPAIEALRRSPPARSSATAPPGGDLGWRRAQVEAVDGALSSRRAGRMASTLARRSAGSGGGLVAVAGSARSRSATKPGSHEQLHVAIGVGAGARGSAGRRVRPALRTPCEQSGSAKCRRALGGRSRRARRSSTARRAVALDPDEADDALLRPRATYSRSFGRKAPSGSRNRLKTPIADRLPRAAASGACGTGCWPAATARRARARSSAGRLDRPERLDVARGSPARTAGRMVRRPGPRPGRVLGRHRRDQPVEAGLAGQLGMERVAMYVPCADRHDPAVVGLARTSTPGRHAR